MKEIFALVVFAILVLSTCILAVGKKIGTAMTAVLLVFSVMAGLVIANYDWLKTARWEVPGILDYKAQIAAIKEEGVREYLKDLENQRSEVKLAMSNVEEARSKAESQVKQLQSMMASIEKANDELKAQQQKITELTQQEERAGEQIAAIQKASSELALLITKVTWLQIEAKVSTGDKRSEAATKQLLDGLDDIVAVVLSDPQERTKFTSEVTGSLPPQE